MKYTGTRYKVKEGDTIEKITVLFGVNQSVWVKYHNSKANCYYERIEKDLPPGLEEIHLMPELWERAEELNYVEPVFQEVEKKPLKLHETDELLYVPEYLCNRYGVVLHFRKTKIHYEIEYVCKGMISHGIHRLAINRGQVYVNDRKPSSKIDEMADQLSKAVYPLLLDINGERKIEKIVNYSEIARRCSEAKVKLSQYYIGEYAEKYFSLFEKQYGNPNNLINHIENELFYQLFFLPIQGSYENQQKRIKHDFSQSINNATAYNLIVSLDPAYTESGKLTVRVISEERRDSYACFEAEYRLYPEDHTIFSIRGHLVKKDGYQAPERTDFEIYHLNRDERINRKIISGIGTNSPSGEGATASRKKKSRFWSLFLRGKNF